MNHDESCGSFLRCTGQASHFLGSPWYFSLLKSIIEQECAAHIPLERGRADMSGMHAYLLGVKVYQAIKRGERWVFDGRFELQVLTLAMELKTSVEGIGGWMVKMNDNFHCGLCFMTYWLGLPLPWSPPVFIPFIPFLFLHRVSMSHPHPSERGWGDAVGSAIPSKLRHLNLSPHPSREGRGWLQGGSV